MQRNFTKRLPGAPITNLPIDYSVQFGDPKRDYSMKSFPFFYNFVKSPFQIGTPDDSFGANQDIGLYRVSSDAAEGPDGLTIAPSGVLDIPIVMDNDTNFHMLYTHYNAFRISVFTLATTDAGDTFAQPASDPFVDGNRIVIDTLTTTTGPIVGISYFVISAGASTFQISLTSGGVAIGLTLNGSAVLRRQAGVAGSRDYLLYPIVNAEAPPPGIVYSVVTTDAGDTFAQPLPVLLSNQMVVLLVTLNTTTGPLLGIPYYVRNVSGTTFQVSLTPTSAVLTLTLNGTATFFVQGILPFTSDADRIPYWTELDVSLYMPSSQNRDIYGGFQRLPIGGATEEAPIPILNLQGNQDGLGMLRTAFQLPRSATVWIRIRSRSRFPLQVYGHIFGYKITE